MLAAHLDPNTFSNTTWAIIWTVLATIFILGLIFGNSDPDDPPGLK